MYRSFCGFADCKTYNTDAEVIFKFQLSLGHSLEEHTSASHLLQVLKEDDFASEVIAPSGGIEKSSFSEANNTRGLDQFLEVFQELYTTANQCLAKEYAALGELVAINGSLIDSVLSMAWADYRTGSKKAKVHLGFDLNRGIPRKIFLSDGKGAERPFVNQILESGQTGVMDRGYHCHKNSVTSACKSLTGSYWVKTGKEGFETRKTEA